VVFDVLEDTNTTDVVSTNNKDGCTIVELDNSIDFTSDKVEL
jgi:hypothetical protein